MSKSKFQLPVDPTKLEAFVSGARQRDTETGSDKPWARYDSRALPKHIVTVRLNDYQMEILKFVAERLDISRQKAIRKYAFPALERLAEELAGKASE